MAVLIAIGMEGYREALEVAEDTNEDAKSRRSFLRRLKERGLKGVRLVITISFLEAAWQRCVVHWYRNMTTAVPEGKVWEVVAMLRAIDAQEDRLSAKQKAALVVEKLGRPAKAAAIVREGVAETLLYMAFPRDTGGACGPTTRWSGSTARCGGGRGWWAPSRTGSPR